jgi:hypothetical protein
MHVIAGIAQELGALERAADAFGGPSVIWGGFLAESTYNTVHLQLMLFTRVAVVEWPAVARDAKWHFTFPTCDAIDADTLKGVRRHRLAIGSNSDGSDGSWLVLKEKMTKWTLGQIQAGKCALPKCGYIKGLDFSSLLVSQRL